MTSRRNFKSDRYTQWRKQVYARDGYLCQLCKNSEHNKLNAHHIRRWANFPNLRYAVSNGITLCRKCHKKITGKEKEYEARFLRITGGGANSLTLKKLLDEED